MKKLFLILVLIFTSTSVGLGATDRESQAEGVDNDVDGRLAILWTSGDPEVAKKMVFIYTFNAKKNNWFKTIRFIIWGPSTKLVSQDKELQEWIKKIKEIGVELYACKWCSDIYGVSGLLTNLGVKVIYYGKPLTKLIKDDWKILTF